MPFKHEFKLAGNLPLPYGVDFAAALQSYSGLRADHHLDTGGRRCFRAVGPTRRPSSSRSERCDQLPALQPARREHQEDIPFGAEDVHLQADVFNVLNSNTIIATNNAIGANLGFVNEIQIGRLPRLAFQMKF